MAYGMEMGRSVLQMEPLLPTRTPRHAVPECPESGESWRGPQQSERASGKTGAAL